MNWPNEDGTTLDAQYEPQTEICSVNGDNVFREAEKDRNDQEQERNQRIMMRSEGNPTILSVRAH